VARVCTRLTASSPPSMTRIWRERGALVGVDVVGTAGPIGADRHGRGHPCADAQGSANTARGVRRFLEELIARVRRAGASGPVTVRFDSGFWANDTIATMKRLDVRYTIAVRNQHSRCGRGDRRDPRAGLDRDRLHRRRASTGRRVRVQLRNRKKKVTRRLIVRRTA
jgi:hypothetical protein